MSDRVDWNEVATLTDDQLNRFFLSFPPPGRRGTKDWRPFAQRVFRGRLLTDPPVTLKQLSAELGIPADRIRAIQARAERMLLRTADGREFLDRLRNGQD